MTTKLVRYQLIAFVVVTVLGITYAMMQYVGLGRMLGIGRYSVSVEMPDTGGLYAGAVVTERGVTIGRVNSVNVHGHGILAHVSLNDGTQIPDGNLRAAVRNTSAVGEQYLEFTPGKSGPPYLRPGSVIPSRDVSLPPSPTQLLNNVNMLLRSVPAKQLGITLNELYSAFNGTGPQLRQLLQSAGNLMTAAQQNITPTTGLINGLRPVLNTQQANSASVRAFSRHLASVSAQLRASDSDLRGTLAEAPGFVSQLDALVGQIQPTVPLLLANLTSVGQVLYVYAPNVRQVLVMLPAGIDLIDAATLASPVPGSAKADFITSVNNPPACTQGYHITPRDPYDTRILPPPAKEPYCQAPANSPTDVRGERNSPCPNNPSIRSNTAAGCGLYFGDTAAAGSAGGTTNSSGGDSAGTYNPSSGQLVGPNGVLYSAGQGTLTGNSPRTLAGLLRQTLGT